MYCRYTEKILVFFMPTFFSRSVIFFSDRSANFFNWPAIYIFCQSEEEHILPRRARVRKKLHPNVDFHAADDLALI